MNQNKLPIDEWLQQQVEDLPISFDESYWNKMEVLLDEEDNKRGGAFWLKGLGMLLIAALLGIGTYLFSHVSKNKNKEVTALHSTASANTNHETNADTTINQELSNTPSADALTNNNTSTSNEMTIQTKQQSLSPISYSTKTKESNLATEQAYTSQSNTNKRSKEAQNNKAQNDNVYDVEKVNETKKQEMPKQGDDEEKLNKTKSKLKNNLAKANQNQSNKQNKWYSKQDATTKNERANSKPNTNLSNEALNKVKDENKDMEVEREIEQIAKQENTTIINGKNMELIESKAYKNNEITKIPYQTSNPRYVEGLHDYAPERYDSVILTYSPVNTEENASDNTTSQILQDIPTKIKKELPLKSSRIYFNLGLNGNFGWNGNNTQKKSIGLAPMVGIGFEKSISSRILIGTQIGFTYINALNLNQQFSQVKYSFGVDSSVFDIEYTKILQIQVPLSINYQLLKNHYLGLSAGISYAPDISSNVKDFNASNSVTTFGYKNGFQSVDAFLQLQYQFDFSQNFSLQMQYLRGLRDRTINGYFNNNIKNYQSTIGIGLKYFFVKNK